jgi:NCS1 family nucleobase:cation symporter-1
MVPLGTIVVTCVGIVCTSCAVQLYPEVDKLLWQPYAFLDAMRRYNDNPGARTGVAFVSSAFIFSQYSMSSLYPTIPYHH